MDGCGKSSCDSSSSLSSTDSFRGRRRPLRIERRGGSFGFSIQSYGIQYCRESDIDIITYVDHVEPDGPAELAGMVQGDVILSINGQDMEDCDHQALVNSIRLCPDRLCMDVTFEDCVRKVRLHMRYIQLQRQLNDRMLALEQLSEHEKYVLDSLRGRARSNSSASLGLSKFALSKFASNNRSRAFPFSCPPKPGRLPPPSFRHVRPARRAQHPVCVWQSQTPALSWDNVCQLAHGACEPPAGAADPGCCDSRCALPPGRPPLPPTRSMENLVSDSQFDASGYLCRRSSELCLSPERPGHQGALPARSHLAPSDTRPRWLRRCGLLRIKSSECISHRLPNGSADSLGKASSDGHKLNANGATILVTKTAKVPVTLAEG